MSSPLHILRQCAPRLAECLPPEFQRYIEPHTSSASLYTYLHESHQLDGHAPLLLTSDSSLPLSDAAGMRMGHWFEVLGLSEAHDFIFFGRPDSELPLSEVIQLTDALSAKGCYVMIAPVTQKQHQQYLVDYLARPLIDDWLMVTNWDPDLFG